MKRLAYLLPALCLGFGLTGCPDDTPGTDVTDTDPDDDDDGDTTGGPSTVTLTTSEPTTTEPPTTTDPPTTTEPDTGSTTMPDECTPDDECMVDEDCPLPGATCTACFCTGGAGCKEYGAGAFGDCANEGLESCMGSTGAGCFADPPGNPNVSVCVSSCEEACDCPQPPAGYEGQLECDDIFTGEGNECIISCDMDEDCPDGWSCFAGTFCAHGEVPELPGYGDCFNLGGNCPDTMSGGAGGCLGIDPPQDESSLEGGVCFAQPCTDVDDCPAAPGDGTAAVACADVTGDMMNDCILDCADGATCPEGMTCHADFDVCYWEAIVHAPYGQCIGVVGSCPAGPGDELGNCLSTDEVSFCSHACTESADCIAPLTGDATPECTNIPMVGNVCVLPCDDMTTCPDDAMCDAGVGGICTTTIPASP